MAKGTWVMRTAVVVSILAHASLIGAAGLRRSATPQPELTPPVDVWAGTTALPVGGDELQDVDVVGSSPAEAAPAAPPAAPATPATPAENAVPADPPKPPPVLPDKPVDKDKPAAPKAPPRPKSLATPKPTPVTDIPDKDESSADKPADPIEPSSKDKSDEQDKPVSQDEPARPSSPSSKGRKPVAAAPAAASSADSPVADVPAKGSSGSFGAEGSPSVRDLGRAFTRALPPACDSDATWAKLAVGSAGSIEVAVIIDEEGKLNGFETLSKNPPAHLINAMKRTLALLKGGLFALQGGSVTSGRQMLRLSVELSDTTVTEDEAAGASAFGLASEWKDKKGVASFTQRSGRHVEISVEFVRVEPRKD